MAQKDNRRIAIEIETGKSDFAENIRQNLLSAYDKILIIAINKKAFHKIEKWLIDNDLLSMNKLYLVLQDKVKSYQKRW